MVASLAEGGVGRLPASPVYVLGNTTGGFIVNALTGELTSMQPLDRESMDVHHLTVAALDVGQPQLTSFATVTVHVLDDNDHCPEFLVYYTHYHLLMFLYPR